MEGLNPYKKGIPLMDECVESPPGILGYSRLLHLIQDISFSKLYRLSNRYCFYIGVSGDAGEIMAAYFVSVGRIRYNSFSVVASDIESSNGDSWQLVKHKETKKINSILAISISVFYYI